MPDNWITALTPTAVQSLTESLTVELFTELHVSGEDGYPPGAQEYQASIHAHWRLGDAPEDDAVILRAASEQKARTEDVEFIELIVGFGRFAIVDSDSPNAYDALDARSTDLELLGAAILGPNGERWADDLDEVCDCVASFAVLVVDVEIDSRWRGAKWGLHATGAVLTELRRDAAIAALYPMSPGLEDAKERSTAAAALTTYWGQLGFTPWRNGVCILDLATVALDEHRAMLAAN